MIVRKLNSQAVIYTTRWDCYVWWMRQSTFQGYEPSTPTSMQRNPFIEIVLTQVWPSVEYVNLTRFRTEGLATSDWAVWRTPNNELTRAHVAVAHFSAKHQQVGYIHVLLHSKPLLTFTHTRRKLRLTRPETSFRIGLDRCEVLYFTRHIHHNKFRYIRMKGYK